MLKYEQYCSYNGGVVSRPLKKWSDSSTGQYVQKAKKCETFIYIYKKPHTFQKSRQFALLFYSQKSGHFTLRDFSCIFFYWHLYIYIKHDTLRYVTFLYPKSQTLRKKQDNFRYVFLYTKSRTLCVTQLFI